jgi:hypothetical protein
MTYDTTSWVHRECQQNRADWYWFQRYLNADFEINSDDPGFPAWGSNPASDSSYRYVPMLWGDWLASMDKMIDWGAAPLLFPAWTNIPGIEIQKTGIYSVRANIDFTIQWVSTPIKAIRFFVYSSNSKVMLLNMKEANTPGDLTPAGADLMTRNFSGYTHVKLEQWDIVFLWIRIYTPTADAFHMTVNSEALNLTTPFPGWAPWKLSGTTFWCALTSLSTQDATW